MILQAYYFMPKHRGPKACQKVPKLFWPKNLWHFWHPEKSQKGAKSLGAKSAVFLVYITKIYSLYTLLALLARGSALKFFESFPTTLDALSYCSFVLFVDMAGAKSAKSILPHSGAKTHGGICLDWYPIFLIEKLDFVRFCLAEAVAFRYTLCNRQKGDLVNDDIFSAPNWPDYDEWVAQLRKELTVRGIPVPSNRELGVGLFHGGIDVLAGKLTCSNQLGWAWDPLVVSKAAKWVSDDLPRIVAQQKQWEREILAGSRQVFQVISLGVLRSRAEIPLADVIAAAIENRFPIWRFDVVRCSIFNLDFLLTDEVEAWAVTTGAAVTLQRVQRAMA